MTKPTPGHPALGRFLARDDGTARLLLVKAAAGTGRSWFANSWVGDRHGEVHDWSLGGIDEEAELEPLVARLHGDAELVSAILLAPSVSTLALASRFPSLVAEHRDLLLDSWEVEALANGQAGFDLSTSRKIHEITGGWLGAVRVLVKDPADHFAARQVIRSGLAVWMQQQDHLLALCEAAYLPKFDVETVESFYGEFSPVVHTLGELVESGLLQPDGHGGWTMPVMVRQVLTELAGSLGRERIDILERAAAEAMALTHGVPAAVESALQRRWWPTLQNLLLDHWTDLFMKDPAKLGAVTAKVPRFIMEQAEYLTVALRMIGMAGKEGMELQLPAFKPDYASDRMAQRLYRDTERLYRKPNGRAVTVGMLEMFHLRLGGFFSEAGVAAQRLRRALQRAVETDRIRPTLAAFAELQAGISLQLAGREIEARQAYEMAYHRAQTTGKEFLLADAAGKLSLLNALEGDRVAANHWLEKHEAAIEKVGWGRKTISHAAAMASGYLAVVRLDFEAVEGILDSLPPMPDNDEFWAVHAYLIAMQRIQAKIPEAARRLVYSLREERAFSAASPLAGRMLDEALLFAVIFEDGRVTDELALTYGDSVMLAYGHLNAGQPDAALAELQKVPEDSRSRRRGNLAIYCEIAARNPGVPTAEGVQRVSRLYQDSGNLAEISLLMRVPGWFQVLEQLDLEPGEIERLFPEESPAPEPLLRRPVLTPREQEILGQLRSGLTRRQMAETGFRSENTVKTQIRSLYRKLDVSDLDQALERARILGL